MRFPLVEVRGFEPPDPCRAKADPWTPLPAVPHIRPGQRHNRRHALTVYSRLSRGLLLAWCWHGDRMARMLPLERLDVHPHPELELGLQHLHGHLDRQMPDLRPLRRRRGRPGPHRVGRPSGREGHRRQAPPQALTAHRTRHADQVRGQRAFTEERIPVRAVALGEPPIRVLAVTARPVEGETPQRSSNCPRS